jgi:hypothetical protein
MVRLVNRVLAAVIALALTAGGLLVAIEIGLAALGRTEPWLVPYDDWYRAGVKRSWDDPVIRRGLIFVALLGLVLVLLQLLRTRPPTLPLREDGSNSMKAVIDRSSLERGLSRAAEDVDGVSKARVRVGRGRAMVVAETKRRDPRGMREQVTSRVREALQRIPLGDELDVTVTQRRRRD